LIGLSIASGNLGEVSCRPQFVENAEPLFEAKELRHPCVILTGSNSFIPNDITLGGDEPNFVLLTGPNMGGKSTLLRQTCIAIIMSQLGCYLPCRSCTLTSTDRIFTRIGAHDNIMAGHSTFMVELQETSRILTRATKQSLVILDELGRGTSTFDGCAIAFAVLHHLLNVISCRGLFSTHYHMINHEFQNNALVAFMHMACIVDEENKKVTFLYKLTKGVSEKSHGMNVAHMAGVPDEIVDRAREVASEFERTHTIRISEHKHLSLARLEDFRTIIEGTSNSKNPLEVVRTIIKSLSPKVVEQAV